MRFAVLLCLNPRRAVSLASFMSRPCLLARAFNFVSGHDPLIGSEAMAERVRVRIFVDFWNLQINWNDYHAKSGANAPVPIPWKELPALLVAEVAKGEPAKFAGIHVYASVNSNSEKDRKLANWLHHSMAGLTGYIVDVRERKPRRRSAAKRKIARPPLRIVQHVGSPCAEPWKRALTRRLSPISSPWHQTTIMILVFSSLETLITLLRCDLFKGKLTSRSSKRSSRHTAMN